MVGDKVTFEDNGTDSVYYTYDPNGMLVSMNLNGAEYFYVRNAQGDIIQLVDKNGATVASYVYHTWGKLVSIKDGNGNDVTNVTTSVGYKNPYRYRGYRYDTETGLYYLNSRYYNPDWGRFINADSLAGKPGVLLSHNLFAYCKNNPVNKSDSSGHKDEYLLGIGLADGPEPGPADVVGVGAYAVDNLAPVIEKEGTLWWNTTSDATTRVYLGIKDGVATYVGIAKDIAIREIQHGDRFDFLREITSNALTRREARAIEQALIEKIHHLPI